MLCRGMYRFHTLSAHDSSQFDLQTSVARPFYGSMRSSLWPPGFQSQVRFSKYINDIVNTDGFLEAFSALRVYAISGKRLWLLIIVLCFGLVLPAAELVRPRPSYDSPAVVEVRCSAVPDNRFICVCIQSYARWLWRQQYHTPRCLSNVSTLMCGKVAADPREVAVCTRLRLV